jgi:hypothetical protein
MPAFRRKEKPLSVDLGNGRDVNLELKPVSVEKSREIRSEDANHRYLRERIDALQKKATDPSTSLEHADRIKKEIMELTVRKDESEFVYTALIARVASWDYYATEEDMRAGRPVPLTEEALRDPEQCDSGDLGKMFLALLDHLREEDNASKNGSAPMNSLPTSVQVDSLATQIELPN